MADLAIFDVELVVADFERTARLFSQSMGFSGVFERTPSGVRSLAMCRGAARVRLTPVDGESEEAGFIARHGSGVRDIGLSVPRLAESLERVVATGGIVTARPSPACATIALFDGLRHTLHEATAATAPLTAGSQGFAIDHAAICVEEREFDRIVDRYAKAFGLQLGHAEYVATDDSAMNSKALLSANGDVKLVFLKPEPGKRKSQIQIFIDKFRGPGVQHVAFLVDDIVHACNDLRDRDIAFVAIPNAYYEELERRVGPLAIGSDDLRRNNIAVDRDGSGVLYQAFTTGLFESCPFFVEIVQRNGAEGFGSGNIKALFRALEIESGKAEGCRDVAAAAATGEVVV